DQPEPVGTHHRHHDLLDLVGLHRVVHRAFPLPVAKLKKAGNAHFFRNLARLEGRGKAGRGPAGLSPGFGGLDRADGVDDFVLGDAALLARLAGADLGQALLHDGVPDRGGGDPGRTDAVAPHDDRLLAPRLVEIRRPERRRVLRAELEDVADLDDLLDAEWLAALDARLAGGDGVEVGEPAVEVTAGADAAQVEPLAVRADDVDAPLAMLGGWHRHPGADRADRPCRR